MRPALERGRSSRNGRFSQPQKKKPGGGNAGSDLFCYRSLRFQVCGLADARLRPKALSDLLLFSSRFCSCSSTFLFFYNVFKFNRSLCDFASFSVRLRTHSSLGGDSLYKARRMPATKKTVETSR